MNSDIYDRLDELAEEDTDTSKDYKVIRKMVTRAPGLNEVFMRTLREHFALPDTIRVLELKSLLVKMEYYYNNHISEQTSNTPLVSASLPTTPSTVASSLKSVLQHTISDPAVTVSGPATSTSVHVTSPPSASIEMEHFPKAAREKQILDVNQRMTVSSNEAFSQNIAANTIRVTFPKAHPKVVLRGRDCLNKVCATSLKIFKRREMANSEIRYSMMDKQGNAKLYSLRSLGAIWHQLEAHEHAIIAKFFRKSFQDQQVERNPLLKYLRKRPPARKVGANRIIKGAKILSHLPIDFSGYDALEGCLCFVCHQAHSLKMIHCTKCMLFAHANCLPDNEESVQEWINEKVECNFCSSYSFQTAESIQGSFELIYETKFFGKSVTYKVDCKVVLFRDSNSTQEATVPTVWLQTFAPELFTLGD